MKKGQFAIFIIVLLLIGGAVCTVVYKSLENKYETNQNNENNNKELNDNEKLVAKIDGSKEWVYEASYAPSETLKRSYKGWTKTVYLSDIKVPFLNVNSTYATSVNEELKKVYDNHILEYKMSLDEEARIGHATGNLDYCTYNYHINNEILSLVYIYQYKGTDVTHPQYVVYNINLKTGDKVSLEEMAKHKNLSYEDFLNKIKSSVLTQYEADYRAKVNELNMGYFTEDRKNTEDYLANTDNLSMYFDSKDDLYVKTMVYYPMGIKHWEELFKIDL